jgi:tRNA nucleotidyltransferase/poly(A) polymerase
LAHKVSRERIGAELEGMFNGPAPVDALRLLETLGLFSTVFSLPEACPTASIPYGEVSGVCMGAAVSLASALGLELDQEDRRFLLMAALLLPLRHLEVNELLSTMQQSPHFQRIAKCVSSFRFLHPRAR